MTYSIRGEEMLQTGLYSTIPGPCSLSGHFSVRQLKGSSPTAPEKDVCFRLYCKGSGILDLLVQYLGSFQLEDSLSIVIK
jgi:hypothetical protein